MNFQAHTVRLIISIGLCVLGIITPVLFLVYKVLFNGITSYQYQFVILLYMFQWLPITSLLWLIAAYVWSDKRCVLAAWIIFGVSICLSMVTYIIWLRLRD